MSEDRYWQRLGEARVATLATIRATGAPRLVPIVYAALPSRRLVTAVDHKPKTRRRLARLEDIEHRPSVAVLAHHYDEEWTRLWWVRAEGSAVVADDPPAGGLEALASKYAQYTDRPPQGPWITITVETVIGWSGDS